ncbi:alginate export family protein [Sphingomonas glacialis]|uniref:alginate export family protein n=1 Tax=Sphingomonas glacialis TaxID=658225 RepID=UPI00112998E2|nr:alginate export family protein [Sphingomonas glacialis]
MIACTLFAFATPALAEPTPPGTVADRADPATTEDAAAAQLPRQRDAPLLVGAPPPVPGAPGTPIPEPVPGGTLGPPGVPQGLRWTEDWSFLADPSKRTSPLEALRYIPLGSDPRSFLSIGGEIRYNYTYFSALNLGAKGKDTLSTLQQRLRLVGDLRIGADLRAFVELGDNREFFDTFATPPNRDAADIMQAFVDVTVPLTANSKVTLRPGRFEMPIGNGKQVGLRDGVNVRYIYQGIRGTYINRGVVRIDAFAVKPVTFTPGAFDDAPEKTRHFNGVYIATAPSLLVPSLGVDLFYYDLYRENARYVTKIGTESRRSWGVRFAGRTDGFDYDAEGTYQTGSFAGERIRAWGVLLEGGYTLPSGPAAPRLGVRANVFSGDNNAADGTIQTFAPPFPRTPLYSDAGWLNFSNLIDVFPSVTLKPAKRLVVVAGPDFFWRQTAGDGVYAGPTNFPLIRPVGKGRFVGTNYNLQGDYIFTKNISFRLFYTHFNASEGFERGGGRSSDYFGLWSDFRF